MITNVSIHNFKSIDTLESPLCRLTVIIGENGGGKTNLLEAIGYGALGLGTQRLEPAVLRARGVRVARPDLVASRFSSASASADPVLVDFDGAGNSLTPTEREHAAQFRIFAPLPPIVRTHASAPLDDALASHGAGLVPLVRSVAAADRMMELGHIARLLELDVRLVGGDRLDVRDLYMPMEPLQLDEESVSDGALMALYVTSLVLSPAMPRFFAIDNFAVGLNPKLAMRLTTVVGDLARRCDKQIVLTTHQPAVLDGLNLANDEQLLVVVFRNADGPTHMHRIAPAQLATASGARASEAWLRGYLGGLPEAF